MNNSEAIKKWEKDAVGKNVHSVYVFCFECKTDGINMPLERQCGNCSSYETTTYYDRETIDIIVNKARSEAFEEALQALDKYFEGLVLVPDPQATKEKIKEILMKLKGENG